MCTRDRRHVFSDADVVAGTLQQFRRTADRERFAILAYCLMPDHAHLLVEGLAAGSDLRRFTKLAKQFSGAAHARNHRVPLWQEGYRDLLLGKDTDAREVARYILWSPVRAGVAPEPSMYPHLGSDVWPLEELLK